MARKRSNAIDLGDSIDNGRVFDDRELELIAAANLNLGQAQRRPGPILFQLPQYCKETSLKKRRDDPDEPGSMKLSIVSLAALCFA